jgi:hypothetical protein
MTAHVATSPTAWTDIDPAGIKVAVNGAWREVSDVFVAVDGQWKYAVEPFPATPANFRATDVGAQVATVTLAWDAAARAASYRLYYRVGTTGALSHFLTVNAPGTSHPVNMGQDIPHQFWIEAVDSAGRASKEMAGPVQVRAGHSQQSIPGGQHTVSAPVRSHSRWRQGTWGYGGSNQPYWGWYNTESYRYQGALEIDPGLLQHYIYAYHGHVVNAAGWGAITCNAAWINLSRLPNVGSWGSTVTAQVSLAWGLNYSGGEMPAQGNIHDIALQPAGARHDYGIPAVWFQAIYQQHGPYNGLVFRAYRNDGGRQAYAGLYADAHWGMTYSWPTIITVHQANTSWW